MTPYSIEPRLRKSASKKVVHEATEAIVALIGNKMADKVLKPKHVINENSRNVEEIIIPPEKETLNKLRQVL